MSTSGGIRFHLSRHEPKSERLPSEKMHGAPTLEEQTRPSSFTPPPQQASLPVKLPPPSLPLQPTPANQKTPLGSAFQDAARRSTSQHHTGRGECCCRASENRCMCHHDRRSINLNPLTAAGTAAAWATHRVGQDPRNAGGAHGLCLVSDERGTADRKRRATSVAVGAHGISAASPKDRVP